MKNLKNRLFVGLSTLPVASFCFANGAGGSMDMSTVTSALTQAGVAVAAVGAAALVVYVGARAWKLIRAAL